MAPARFSAIIRPSSSNGILVERRIALFLAGVALGLAPVSLAGAILFGHSSFDRLMGLGLKEGDSFSHAELKPFRATGALAKAE